MMPFGIGTSMGGGAMQPPPTSPGQPVSSTPGLGRWAKTQAAPAAIGTALAGLFGGGNAAASFATGASNRLSNNLLEQRQAEFDQEQRYVKRAEEIVNEWNNISLTQDEWEDYGITPGTISKMQELSQKWTEATQASSERGKAIGPNEAKAINALYGSVQPEMNKIRQASQRAERARGQEQQAETQRGIEREGLVSQAEMTMGPDVRELMRFGSPAGDQGRMAAEGMASERARREWEAGMPSYDEGLGRMVPPSAAVTLERSRRANQDVNARWAGSQGQSRTFRELDNLQQERDNVLKMAQQALGPFESIAIAEQAAQNGNVMAQQAVREYHRLEEVARRMTERIGGGGLAGMGGSGQMVAPPGGNPSDPAGLFQ